MTTRRRFVQICSAAGIAAQLPAAASDAVIAKAMASMKAAIPLAASDPQRPIYHFHPPANWNNDPNGTLFYRGWHHLFYQLNPYGSEWGHMHWGHARSRNLVDWEHLPIALGPSEDQGEQHVFSGAAMIAGDGRPRLFYTSIGQRDPEQWMALPEDDDLLVWRKYEHNPVLTTAIHGAHKVRDWRDPFLFREAGQTYMVCGGNTSGWRAGGTAQVQLYRALNDALTEWKHLGAVFEDRNRETVNIECPNLFKLDQRWVLITSPHKACEYFVGSLDLARGKFVPETRGPLDAGPAYASNISVDDKGRTLLWLWAKTDTPAGKGWNNVIMMPRILSLTSDGYLSQQPAPEFEKLRTDAVELPAASLTDQTVVLEGVQGDSLEIEAEWSTADAASFGLELRRSAAGKPGAIVTLTPRAASLSVGPHQAIVGRRERYTIRLFLDKRALEVYMNEGSVAMYSTVDGGPGDLGMAAFARGGTARLERLKAWRMQPAEFDLAAFEG
jgi:beta-fructofuranosidase